MKYAEYAEYAECANQDTCGVLRKPGHLQPAELESQEADHH